MRFLNPPRFQRMGLGPRLACLLLLSFYSCGGPPPELTRAEFQFGRGDLQAASRTLESLGSLEGDAGTQVRALQLKIKALATSRAALQGQVAGTRLLDFKQARAELKGMLARSQDPWTRDAVNQELSDLADRVAENRGRPTKPLAAPKVSAPPASGPTAEQLAQQAAEQEAKLQNLLRMQAAIAETARAAKEAPAQPVEKEIVSAPPAPEPKGVKVLGLKIESDRLPDLAPEVSGRLLQSLNYSEYELEEAHPADRERAADTLHSLYPRDGFFLRRALRVRWERTTQALLKSPELEQLTLIHQKHMELRSSRAAALELIFDTRAYFYPYTVPDCSLEKARTYGAVQDRVEDLTEALEKLWSAPQSQVLSKQFFWQVEELAWQREYGQSHWYYPSLPSGLDSWVLWLGAAGHEVTVRNFTARRSDLVALAYDRVVEAYNREWWGQKGEMGLSREATAAPQEQRQVRITNEYRRMFGVPALAWNPLLQESARGHAAYMREVGKVTHTQERDPARRSPFDRMALVGYNYGASENCSEGFVPPESAHKSWRRSSAHHRNLLNPDFTELGSALVGTFWTQNFGTGRDFQSELDTWQD